MTLPNPIGILVAAFAVMMLGWLWFDKLFGRRYKALLGRDPAGAGDPSPLYFAGPSLCMLVTTVAISVLMHWLAVDTLSQTIGLGLLVGVGLLASTAVNMGINPNIPRPLAYGFLSASYFTVASLMISILIFLIGRR